jgi:hypothetical protein
MIKWSKLIEREPNVVQDFALGQISGRDFSLSFPGRPNDARQVIRTRGVAESRILARKALNRRGLLD